jgi:hypothetical protein
MSCYRPLRGYLSKKRNKSGKRSVVFNHRDGLGLLPVTVPCGQCIGCRLDRSLDWAMRSMCEAEMHDCNCFLTLTFDDKNLKKTLDKRDFQLFIKRLRRWIETHTDEGKSLPRRVKNPRKIRYLHCGEYGGHNGRPHHHACIFGWYPPDAVLWSERQGVRLYRSAIVESLWSDPVSGDPKGFCTVGDVTFESAAYVARYVLKKWSDQKLKGSDLYKAMTEARKGLVPEYITMSRRPALGDSWAEKYHMDIWPHDYIVDERGHKHKPPRYFDKKLELTHPELYRRIKELRIQLAKDMRAEQTSDRLYAREVVKESKIKTLTREL